MIPHSIDTCPRLFDVGIHPKNRYFFHHRSALLIRMLYVQSIAASPQKRHQLCEAGLERRLHELLPPVSIVSPACSMMDAPGLGFRPNR